MEQHKCSKCKSTINENKNNEELFCFYDIHHNILCYNCCKQIMLTNEKQLVVNRKKNCVKHFYEYDGYDEASCIKCGTIVCIHNESDIDILNQ